MTRRDRRPRPPPGSERDSLLSTGPPPPYDAAVPSYSAVQQPCPACTRRTEVRISNHDSSLQNPKSSTSIAYDRILSALLVVFVGLFILGAVFLTREMTTERDPLDPIERDRVRQEWERERQAYETEHQHRIEMRKEWDREDRAMMHKRQQWEVDRRKHDEEVREWLEERARQLGKLWSEPQPSSHCAAYGTREYTAQLDDSAACRNAPLMIHNRTVTTTRCEVVNWGYTGRSIVGHFTVDFDEPACRPYWGRLYDKGCVTRGQYYGMHRVESRLWGLHRGDDWQWICDTTPATIYGIEFAHPSRCENRGIFFGMVGMFEYPDPACGWNALSADEIEQLPDSEA